MNDSRVMSGTDRQTDRQTDVPCIHRQMQKEKGGADVLLFDRFD